MGTKLVQKVSLQAKTIHQQKEAMQRCVYHTEGRDQDRAKQLLFLVQVVFVVAEGSRLGQRLALVRFCVEASGWHKMEILSVYLEKE